MRYARAVHIVVRAASAVLNGFRSKRLNVGDLSDYMRRDIGLIDGRETACENVAEGDVRSRRLDLLAITPYAA